MIIGFVYIYQNLQNMFTDFFKGVYDNAHTRIKNPLLGTLIAVWIVRNFNFLYALFNFHEEVTLTQRIDYFRRYFNEYGTIWHVLLNIVIAFGIMILTFSLLLLSKWISNLYSRFIDKINEKSDDAAIVSIEKYKRVKDERDSFSKEKDALEESLSNRNKDFNLLTEEHKHLNVVFDEYKKSTIHKVDEYSLDTNNLRKEVDELKSELADALLKVNYHVDDSENLFQFLERKYQSVKNEIDVLARDAALNYLKTAQYMNLSDEEKTMIKLFKDLDNGRHLSRVIKFFKDINMFLNNNSETYQEYLSIIEKSLVLPTQTMKDLDFPRPIVDFIGFIMTNTPK